MAALASYGYKVERMLGEGSFGAVFMCSKAGSQVAIKHIKKRFHSWTECLQQREVASLHKCQKQGAHPNVVALREVIHAKNDGSVFIVMEFVHGGTLYDAAKRSPEKYYESPAHMASVTRDILSGLSHMHRRGFFHRDIKPENCLVATPGEVVKLADFGCAREIRSAPPYTDYVSTRWYRAPENALRATAYSCPVDLWATGCVLAELLALKPRCE